MIANNCNFCCSCSGFARRQRDEKGSQLRATTKDPDRDQEYIKESEKLYPKWLGFFPPLFDFEFGKVMRTHMELRAWLLVMLRP